MFLSHFKENMVYKLSILIPTFLVSSWAIFLLIHRIFQFPNRVDRAVATLFYYTTQSNLLVWFVLCFSFTRFIHKGWFKKLSLIALIDIMMTGIVFHIFLTSFLNQVELMQHVLHTIVPIAFAMFYMLVLSEKIAYKKFYIALIHPVIFLLFVYFLAEPFFGDILNVIYPTLPSARYIYPFLDPQYYTQGVLGLSGIIIGVFAPFISLITLLVIYLTSSYSCYIDHQNHKKKDAI